MIRSRSVLCCALLLVIHAGSPRAAEPGARPAGRGIELFVAARGSDVPLVEAAVRDMLVAKGLEVTSARTEAVTREDVAAAATATAGEATSIVARVLIDLTVPGEATLFLIDPRRGRVHVRRLALEQGFDAVARETTLFVIGQSIDAILEGREIGVTREEYQRSVAAPPPPALPAAPPSAPPPPSGGQTRLSLAGGYDGVAIGSGEYQHAAKVVFAARFVRLRLAAAARVAAPISIAGGGVQARLSTGGLGLSGAASLLTVGGFSAGAGLGVGLDLTRVEPAVTTPDLRPAAAFWDANPSLRAFAEVEYLFGRISVAIAAGAEARLLAERYTVRIDSETRDVFVPRRVRPEAAVLAGVLF